MILKTANEDPAVSQAARQRRRSQQRGDRRDEDEFSGTSSDHGVSVRHLIDLLVTLTIAVILVRNFEIEGYMITTGSMAPGLRGYHKQVVCPSCRFEFGLGTRFDASVQSGEASAAAAHASPEVCACPNCGLKEIDVRRVPVNPGDQLLVDKAVYRFRRPRRWEVAVFRNPAEPTEAYVKRIVGLPGETVQVVDGEVLINGTLQRKSYEEQLATRASVHDSQFAARDNGWQPRWSIDGGWTRSPDGFQFRTVDAEAEPAWVSYRHRIRDGGHHETSVRLPNSAQAVWPAFATREREALARKQLNIRFDTTLNRLVCVGVMSDDLRQRLLAASRKNVWRLAVEQLYARSHFAPVVDDYGYNSGEPLSSVKDLMVSFETGPMSKSSLIQVRLATCEGVYRLILDGPLNELRVCRDRDDVCVFRKLVPWREWKHGLEVDFSGIDRQLLLAINSRMVFDPIELTDAMISTSADVPLLQIGVSAGELLIHRVRIFRDLYYTPGRSMNGVVEPYKLSDTEFFVLGDNSPVSSDSRNWVNAAVPEHLLIGKPVVVHLPSKSSRIQFGGEWRTVRVPDWPRMRYIR